MSAAAETCGVLILAAGGSTRLGRPKQLIRYKEKTLIRRLAEEAQKFAGDLVFVVTGAHGELISSEIASLKLTVVQNPDWKTGMSSSIICGVKAILSKVPDLRNLIITVCDQPHVSAELFNTLFGEKIQSRKLIVAAAYNGVSGVPVLFDHKYFKNLLQLEGQQGAKSILTEFEDDCETVNFPAGALDIDTEDDYNRLLSEE